MIKLSARAESEYRVQNYGEAPRIEGLVRIDLDRHADEGGWIAELMRPAGPPPPGLEGFRPAQINYSRIHPDVTKAFHIHREQTDVWFVPPEDRLLVVLADLREGSATEGNVVRIALGNGRTALLRIPPGVAHGCRNLGSRAAGMVYLTDREFSTDPASCDEGRLPWDFLGPEVWEIPRD